MARIVPRVIVSPSITIVILTSPPRAKMELKFANTGVKPAAGRRVRLLGGAKDAGMLTLWAGIALAAISITSPETATSTHAWRFAITLQGAGPVGQRRIAARPGDATTRTRSAKKE